MAEVPMENTSSVHSGAVQPQQQQPPVYYAQQPGQPPVYAQQPYMAGSGAVGTGGAQSGVIYAQPDPMRQNECCCGVSKKVCYITWGVIVAVCVVIAIIIIALFVAGAFAVNNAVDRGFDRLDKDKENINSGGGGGSGGSCSMQLCGTFDCDTFECYRSCTSVFDKFYDSGTVTGGSCSVFNGKNCIGRGTDVSGSIPANPKSYKCSF